MEIDGSSLEKEVEDVVSSLTVERIETTCVAGASVRIESVIVEESAPPPPGAGGVDMVVLSWFGQRRKKEEEAKRSNDRDRSF